MQIKIWGARGSTPAPLGPEVVRDKIVSALLGIAKIEDKGLREELASVLLQTPDQATEASGPGIYEKVLEKIQIKRRQVIEAYLDTLSPLSASTAGGNTPCIEVRSGNDLIIIDAGSGIRALGQELMKGPWGKGEGGIHLLFSHPHWDHIQGFPFFRPAFIPGNKIHIYSFHDLETALRRQQDPISFPVSLDYMQATFMFNQLETGKTLEIGNLTIRTIRNEHPGDAYGFRFEKGNKAFVYASDAAYPTGLDKQPHINFFDKADVLIFDAQFRQREADDKEDWGHSSSFEGVELAQQSGVKKLVLFHHDPAYTDYELEEILDRTIKFQKNQYPTQRPVEIIIGQEGLTFDLTPEQTAQVHQIPGSKAAMLQPVGIFDERAASELRQQLTEITKTEMPPQLIIDMSAVELLQVAGLRALVKLRKEYQEQGVPTALVNPSISVQQLIELAGYREFFAIYSSVRDALKVFEARETLNLPGQMLKNRYRIEEKMGEGRLGTVFRAVDTQQNMPVAIKILSPSFSEGAIEQFLRQGRQIIDLIHPNIVGVYECAEDRGIAFMVEEFVKSRTLRDLLTEYSGRSLPFDIALSIAESMTRGLEYAHGNDVIHGDLKPKNVLLSSSEAKISDFGLGRLESGKSLININVPLTLVTARYLAPEQILGHPIDARTDLYALGVVLYEIFTGQPPFDGPDHEVLEHHRDILPAPPRNLNPNISRSLEHLILKLLDKDPNKRYATARQVRHILMSMLTPISGQVKSHGFTIEQWPALVGREAELSRLMELWAETKKGRGQVALINGEAGIGKTRLVQEFTYSLDEAAILVGHCSPLEGSAAFYPFVSALQSYFENAPSGVVQESTGQFWRELAQLVPEFTTIVPRVNTVLAEHLKGSPADSPDTYSHLMLAQSLAHATAQRPWLLIIEDLQWIDHSSLILLDYLARYADRVGLMIVCLYDSDNLKSNKSLTDTLDRLSHLNHCASITLERLVEGEVKDMLQGMWLQLIPDSLVFAINNVTRGNPLFVKEIANGLVDEGIINWRDNKWYFGSFVEAGLPKHIHEAIQRRINRLSRETQTFLSQAAIFNPNIKFKDLHEMSDLSEWDALESLDIALERQLLREVPGENILRFSHAKIQEVLYQGLSALRQRLMHREAGEALERQYPAEPKYIGDLLAHHFFEAGELEKGLIYSIQAATQARNIYAQESACYWYARALEAENKLNLESLTQEHRFELLLAREQSYSFLGDRPAQVNDLAALQDLAGTLNDPAKQALAHYRQARYAYVTGNLADAESQAQAALTIAHQTDQAVLERECLTQLAYLALHRGQFDQAQAHLQAAQAMGEAGDASQAQIETFIAWGILFKLLNNYLESETHLQHALETSLATGNRYGQAKALMHLGDTHLKKGEYEQASLYLQRALTISQFISYQRGEAICLNKLAALNKELGRYDEALRFVEQAVALRHNIEDGQGLADDLHLLGAIHLALGNRDTAYEKIEQALIIVQQSQNKIFEGGIWLDLGLVLESIEDDLSKATQAYEQANHIFEALDNKLGALDAKIGLARCLFAQGKTGDAQQVVVSILDEPGLNGVWGMKYPLNFYLSAYKILDAAGNAKLAREALEKGQILLQLRANTIGDDEVRSSFLENVAENKALSLYLGNHEIKETAN